MPLTPSSVAITSKRVGSVAAFLGMRMECQVYAEEPLADFTANQHGNRNGQNPDHNGGVHLFFSKCSSVADWAAG